MQKKALYTSGAIFGIGAIAHFVRLFTDFAIIIDGITLPTWASVPSAIIAALLSIWMLKAAQES